MKFKNLMHIAWGITRMHALPSCRIPLSMHIVLTNRCNNRCIYCRAHKLSQTDVWTTQSLKNVICDMKKCGTRRIQFTGGEPMLRSDVGELVVFAKKLGFFVGISTNGYKVAERIDELKNVDVVFLSYDGPPLIHSRLRGKQSVGDVERALTALKREGIRVWTTTVLTTRNANHVKEIVDFALKHNIVANFNRLEFFLNPPCHLHPPFKEVQDLALKGNYRKKVFQELIQLKISGAPIGSSLQYLQNALEWPHDDRITDSTPSKRYQCWAGRAFGHLEANGMLYPCGWGVRQIPGVNVLSKGFRSAWEKLIFLQGCRSCSHACDVESNLIYSLNPSSILNAFVNLRR